MVDDETIQVTEFPKDLSRMQMTMSRSDDGGNKHLWNVGKLLADYMVQQLRRQAIFIFASVRTWNLTCHERVSLSNCFYFQRALGQKRTGVLSETTDKWPQTRNNWVMVMTEIRDLSTKSPFLGYLDTTLAKAMFKSRNTTSDQALLSSLSTFYRKYCQNLYGRINQITTDSQLITNADTVNRTRW
jgi:hypothetical protein